MEPNNNTPVTDNEKNISIISYITIIGWLIAYFGMYQKERTELASYQLRQTLLLHIVSIALLWIVSIIFTTLLFTSGFTGEWFFLIGLNWVIRAILITLWFIGLMGAMKSQMKPIPLIGKKAQTLFPKI